MAQRICIFVHFDVTNTIGQSVEHYLHGLKKVCDEIVFVSNSDLSSLQKDKVAPWVSKIILRENSGMDFGAWKHSIDQIGWSHISKFDELVLANDSCYAPMFPFDEMFKSMSQTSADFWGVTEHPAANTRAGQLKAHLQSYFLVFSRKVVMDESFQQFWQRVSCAPADYESIIRNSEAELTPVLNKAGFTHRAYLNDTDFIGDDTGGNWTNSLYFNRTIWSWKNLLQHRSPFLKRRAIPFHFERVSRLIRTGYGKKVTDAAHKQTFFWRDCILDSKSNYPIAIVNTDLQTTHAGLLSNSIQRRNRLLFQLFRPYRAIRKIKRTIKEVSSRQQTSLQ